jgi:FkbM family methyltransferase
MPKALNNIARMLLGENLYRVLATVRRARKDRFVGRSDDVRRATFYRSWIQPGDLVFDVGANIGNRTRVFADLGARVIAVEPLPHCYWALRWTFKFQPWVIVVGAAASYDNSQKRLTQFETDTISTLQQEWILASEKSGRFGTLSRVRELSVPCITLDQLIGEFGVPTFTKIDVEGSEPDVLRGLSRPAGTLSFEVTPDLPHLGEQCLTRLELLGYRKFQLSIGESMNIGERWLDASSMRAELTRFSSRVEAFGDVYALAPEN